jgi:hypothetical protein
MTGLQSFVRVRGKRRERSLRWCGGNPLLCGYCALCIDFAVPLTARLIGRRRRARSHLPQSRNAESNVEQVTFADALYVGVNRAHGRQLALRCEMVGPGVEEIQAILARSRYAWRDGTARR